MSIARLGENGYHINVINCSFDVYQIGMIINFPKLFVLLFNVLASVCLSKRISFAHIGQGNYFTNQADFDLESMRHILEKISLNFLKHSNGILNIFDYRIKSLSKFKVIMSEQHLLTKFALSSTPRILEGFDCFLWASKK
jgi:hypothetical protein